MKLRRGSLRPAPTQEEIVAARLVLFEAGYAVVKNDAYQTELDNAYKRGFNAHVLTLQGLLDPLTLEGYPDAL